MTCLIPICFYPTRKLLIDDNESFLQSSMLRTYGENFINYSSPQLALKYLLKEYQPSLTKLDLLKDNLQLHASSTQHVINFDISKLNHTNQDDISVIFIDYNMPDINGINLLDKISHLPVKRVLITGISDDQIAIDAFNSGLIDAYLRKDDPDFVSKFQTLTKELVWKYFTDLCIFISDIPEFSYLKNVKFARVFKNYLNDNKVSSFYLRHINGNFILEGPCKESKHVLIRNKMQLKELARIAKEDGASETTINHLDNGNMIPYFNSCEYWEVPASRWDNYLHPAEKIAGDNQYVWSIVNTAR